MFRRSCIKTIKNVILFLLFFSSAILASEVKNDTAKEIVEVDKKIIFIEVSEVPKEVSLTKTSLHQMTEQLKPNEELTQIHLSLPSYSESIQHLLSTLKEKEFESLNIKSLSKLSSDLSVYLRDLKKWSTLLDKQIALYDKELKQLNQASILWQETYNNASKKEAPDAILDQITEITTHIKSLSKKAKNIYDSHLTDINTINTDILSLETVLKEIDEADRIISSRLFYKNSLSLSEILTINSLDPLKYITSVFDILKDNMHSFIIYYTNTGSRFILFAFLSFLICIFVGVIYYLYIKHKLFVYEESYQNKKYFFILRPFSTALALILFLNVFMFTDISETAKAFQRLILLVPVFRIFQTLVPSSFYKYIYGYFILYIFAIIERTGESDTLDARLMSIFLSVALGVYFYKLIKNRVIEHILDPKVVNIGYKMLYLFILLLFISIISDIYGATLLASYISNTIFVSLYAMITFYMFTVILTGYTIILLRRRIATATHMVERYARDIEKSIIFFVKFFMTLWWFVILLKSVNLYGFTVELMESILALSWEVGKVTISIASIVDFFLIIAGTWFIAKLIRMILEVEIFARFRFPRGIPTAIHTVLNYIIVISGTIVALSSLGITNDQFTLVIGALGVGIGFGLRNIIANFISGLIMVFERPIQIGDTIEINNTTGTVQGIGARSSTIATFDGSEVIIPNADFISKDITNWTLSDSRRRKTLNFKVASKSDIHKVLEIMNTVVTSHPNVLKDPQPIATFVGFGDYYLEFKLYFWLHENLIIAQSDIAIGIYEMLKKEGIEMPKPMQEFIRHEKNQ